MKMRNIAKNTKNETKVRIELTGIAEEIIDNYVRMEVKNVIMRNKKDGWKYISFDYKDKSYG